MSITPITSSSHFQDVLGTSTYVVADFYADWCGPCKAIAPVFSSLATAESKPGRMTFVKVDVDSQQSIARQYGVSAMPTFLIFKNGSVSKTLRGADPNGLRSAVLAASSDASNGPAKSSTVFQSQGHVLGNQGQTAAQAKAGADARARRAPVRTQGQGFQQGLSNFLASLLNGGFMDAFIRFVGLYIVTLFSLDPKASAEASALNVAKKRQ